MYIEQGYRGNLGLWKYLILPTGFIAFMVFNYIATINSPVSVEDMMAGLIAEFGTNTVLIMVLLPLALGLFVVLGWTKLVHPQSIRSLTTAREKIDWSRVLFAFVLWGGLTAGLTCIDYLIFAENYVFNLNWPAFLKLATMLTSRSF